VSNYALNVSATFFGEVVEETFARQGAPLRVGGTEALAIPVPEGWPYVAEVRWLGADRVEVRDGAGGVQQIGPEGTGTVGQWPVEVTFALAKQVRLRRMEDIPWRTSVAWLAVIVCMTGVAQQATLAYDYRCEGWQVVEARAPGLASRLRPHVVEDPQMRACFAGATSSGAYMTSEYLARLLEDDLEGAESSAVEASGGDAKKGDQNKMYMPAGDAGPLDNMGGAAQAAPERQQPEEAKESEEAEQKKKAARPKVEAVEVGTPVADAVPLEEAPSNDPPTPEIKPPEPDSDGDDDASTDATATEEGFGLRDWYDEGTEQVENLEIDLMLRYAKQRLRIDPNDPSALAMLSYYQYLAEDYDAALATYDKIIRLNPEESAGYNNKALVYKRLGQYEKEEALYRVALSLSPSDDVAMNNLAVNLSHQGRFEEATAIMDELARLTPGDPYAELHRAKIHAAKGEDEAAIAALERALQAMQKLDTLHHIEFRQDIRLDPSFARLREDPRFRAVLVRYYGAESPLGGR
jgi:tetratricopeptide (TPR) repeat protein